MKRVLLTSFEPYGRYPLNSSWLAMVELTAQLPSEPEVTTRRYPVDFAEVRRLLAEDMTSGYDAVLLTGQTPGASQVLLEAVGLNLGSDPEKEAAEVRSLVDEGPLAYRSALPLEDWSAKLRAAGIPARVSFHAGTYLCNASLYWAHYLAERQGLATQAAFIHLPLAPEQVAHEKQPPPSLASAVAARAVRLLLEELA